MTIAHSPLATPTCSRQGVSVCPCPSLTLPSRRNMKTLKISEYYISTHLLIPNYWNLFRNFSHLQHYFSIKANDYPIKTKCNIKLL